MIFTDIEAGRVNAEEILIRLQDLRHAGRRKVKGAGKSKAKKGVTSGGKNRRLEPAERRRRRDLVRKVTKLFGGCSGAASQVPVAQSQYFQWERDERPVPDRYLERLNQMLGEGA